MATSKNRRNRRKVERLQKKGKAVKTTPCPSLGCSGTMTLWVYADRDNTGKIVRALESEARSGTHIPMCTHGLKEEEK